MKKLEPQSTLIQFLSLLQLEKHEKLKVKEICQLILHSNEDYVANEINYLIFHPSWNRTKDPKIGIILSDAEGTKSLTPENYVWLNKGFRPSNIRPSTLPIKVIRPVNFHVKFNYLGH